MRTGIYFDMRNPAPWARPWDRFYADTLTLIEQAEAWGIDSVWFSEHHLFEDGYLPQPLTMAAAAAARTTRVRLGTAILVAPFRRAIQIAEEAAIVDLVSGGRLDLGLGAGYVNWEFEQFGADSSRRYGTTDQIVRDLREMLGHAARSPRLPCSDPFLSGWATRDRRVRGASAAWAQAC